MKSQPFLHNVSDSLDQQDYNTRLKQLATKMLSQKRNYCTKCKSKNCTKHLERYRCVKLSMLPVRSNYSSSFHSNSMSHVDKIQVPTQHRRLSSVVDDSLYQHQFKKSKSIERQGYCKGKDNIKPTGLPFTGISTYFNAYPQSQKSPYKQTMIKNPENISVIPIKLNAQSSYRGDFKNSGPQQRAVPIKRQGQLRVNGSFIGQSTYKNGYVATQRISSQSFKPKNNYKPVSGMKIQSSYQSQFLNYPSEAYIPIQEIDQTD